MMSGFFRRDGTIVADLTPQEISVLLDMIYGYVFLLEKAIPHGVDDPAERTDDDILGPLYLSNMDQPSYPGADSAAEDSPNNDFDVWEEQLWGLADAESVHVPDLLPFPINRLFPAAYPLDAEATREFRRLTMPTLCTQRINYAQVVINDIIERQHSLITITAANVDAWLSVLTGVRLVTAGTLGIAEPGDELSWIRDYEGELEGALAQNYMWLGAVVEAFVNVIDQDESE